MTNLALGLIMLVGSYGAASDSTFHVYDFDLNSGETTCIEALTGLQNPSFLTVCDGGETILTANENYGQNASVTMLKKDDSGLYKPVATAPTGANGPCHIAVAPNGKYCVTANYGERSISVIPFDSSNNSFGKPFVKYFEGHGPVELRQAEPHPHFTSFSPDRRLMIVDDLGTDRLHLFPLDSSGYPQLDKMQDVVIEPGSGPRHLVFSRDGRFTYLINEISGTITQLAYDSKALTLKPIATTFADYQHGEGSGDIRLSPDGRYLYISNRLKGDGIATFTVDSNDGSLHARAFTPTGIHPRNFNITPDGRWLIVACRDDNRLEIYRRNPASGLLTLSSTIPCPKPVCVEFY